MKTCKKLSKPLKGWFRNKMKSRLGLGTVQFGQKYGIANKRGKVSEKEVWKILQYAESVGINCLDTAFSYGDSELVLGKYLRNHTDVFQVVSKLPEISRFRKGMAKEFLKATLKRLHLKKLHGYLIHKFEDFLKNEALWDEVADLRKQGLIERAGFSLYLPKELEILLKKDIDFDLVQVPYSVFDRRFEKYFPRLKEKNIEIHARSVFLQGLAFLALDRLPEALQAVRPQLESLRELAKERGISVEALGLNFVLLNPDINKVIIGVDGLTQLKNNVMSMDSMNDIRKIYGQLNKVRIEHENFLLPYKWTSSLNLQRGDL